MKTKAIILVAFYLLISIQTFGQTRLTISSATASSTLSGTSTSNAYDASGSAPNYTTYWSPATTSNSEYIQFDLGASNTYYPSQIIISFKTPQFPYSMDVTASTDGTTWTTVAGGESSTTININLNGTILYRYIKLTKLSVYQSSNPAQLTDISIYSSPNVTYNNVTVNGTLYSNNVTTSGNQITLQTAQGSLGLSSNSGTNFTINTDRPFFYFARPVTFSQPVTLLNTITTSNINSTGDCSVQGTTITGGTPGVIKLGGAFSNGYPEGGNVVITAGTGYTNGDINLNVTAGTAAGAQNSGQIYLNGRTNVVGSFTTSGLLTANGGLTIGYGGTAPSANSAIIAGNVGIGTTTPTPHFLQSKALIVSGADAGTRGIIEVWGENSGKSIIQSVAGSTYLGNLSQGTGSGDCYLTYGNGATGIFIKGVTGNVGIGCTNPGSLLTVNGKIQATEVEILATVPCSDYVFEPDYKLKNLSEIENYVKTNKHLPEIPSAKEFKEKGYSVGQMDDLLLRKVEELTLYIIDQQKEIAELKKLLKKE